MDKVKLSIVNLTKYYGKVRGVENLNLELTGGMIFGFIGPNGAGKSTTIRSIMNLINKTSGSVLINGIEFTKNNLELKKMVGYLPSEINLYEGESVKKILDYHMSFYKENLTDRCRELVEYLELDTSKNFEDLSLGNKKKLGIILALLHNPKILILDEPTSGLDPLIQNKFYKLLIEEKKKGTLIFYSTHVLSEVSKICDKVGIIRNGTLEKVLSIKNLFDETTPIITVYSKNIDDIIKNDKFKIIDTKDNQIRFKTKINTNLLLKELNKYDIDKILIEEAKLEDLFLEYYEEV